MSLSIDELSSLYGMYGVNGLSQNSTQSVTSADAEEKATDGDSYISTIAGLDPNAAIPSENYNDLAKMIKSAAGSTETSNSTEYASVSGTTGTASSTTGVTSTTSEASTETAGAVGGAGGSGGGSSSDSDDDEDSETEVVTINGQTYLQVTTTDSNGNTTVTRTPIGGTPVDETKGVSAAPSAAAQALA